MIFKGPPPWGYCSAPGAALRFEDAHRFVEALKAGLCNTGADPGTATGGPGCSTPVTSKDRSCAYT